MVWPFEVSRISVLVPSVGPHLSNMQSVSIRVGGEQVLHKQPKNLSSFWLHNFYAHTKYTSLSKSIAKEGAAVVKCRSKE